MSVTEVDQFATYFKEYMEETKTLLDMVEKEGCKDAVTALFQAWQRDATVFVMGNGGSATNAMHFANCLSQGTYTPGKKPLRAQALVDNLCTVTAVSNDFGYDQAFAKQLEMCMRPGDLVVGMSCSGNSPNVVNAFEYARTHGIFTIGFLGFSGGKMRSLSDCVIYIDNHNYGQVETIHMSVGHLISQRLKEAIAQR